MKSRKDERLTKIGREQLKKSLSELNIDVPAYLVFPKTTEPFFELEKYSQEIPNVNSTNDLNEKSFFNYQYSRQARIIEKLDSVKNKKESTIDHFKYVCWIMAFIIFVFIILQKIKWICVTLDYNDLLIIGVAIVLILLPFTSKINVLGVEISRLEKS